jgi:hypothetical protein
VDRRLVPTRQSLTATGVALMGATIFAVAVVLVGVDWKALAVLWGTGVGIAVFGVATWFREVAPQVPSSGEVPELPIDAEVDRPFRFRAAWLLAGMATCLGAVWLEDHWGLGAALIPGQLAGSAVANLFGAALVARWERRHGMRVVSSERRDGDDTDLFAQQPPLISG